MPTKPPLKTNRRHSFRGAARVALLFLLALAPLVASEHHGTVKFNGVPVPGATVTASQGDKKFVAVTDEQGDYRFAELADGVWNIRVEMLCFEPLTQEIAVAADAPSPAWELKLMSLDAIKAAASNTSSAISASVEKAAPATQTATVGSSTQAANPSLSAAVAAANAKEAANAPPAKGKNAKGKKGQPAASTTANAQGFQRTDVQASGNGGGNDGAGSGGAPQQSTPDAGQASDAFVINGSANNGSSSSFATNPAFGNNRRGFGPRYNGAINMTMDNSLLDANQFSLNGEATPKPYYNHLKGNVSFGGPLVIPHLMPLSRTSPNFFVGYQWTRNRNAYTRTGLMPTEAEREGDFSQAVSALGQPLTIVDPTTGLPFPNNVIPQSRISPQAAYLLKFYPQPNSLSNRYNYQISDTGLNSSDGVQGRVNKIINNKNNTSLQFGWQRTSATSPSIFGFTDTTSTSGFQATQNWSHRFSQRMFLNMTFSFSRGSQLATPYFANLLNVSGEAGITGNNQEPQNWGPPSLGFSGSGISGLSDGNQSYTRSQTGAIGGNLYWNHRSHNVTGGGDFRKQQFNFLSQSNPRGSFGFTGAATEATANGAPVQNTGSDFADFLLGTPDSSNIAFGNADKYLRESVYDAYIDDDWRMRAGFSLRWGLRWEYSAPITEKYGRLVNLDINQAWASSAPVVANDPTGPLTGLHYPDSLLRPDKGGFEPRIGFAWHPILGSSTVVRGSYGIYRDTSIYTSIASRMAQQSPLSKSLSVANSPLDPLTLADGFNASPNTTTNTFAVDPNFRVGYAQIWNFSIQRDLPAGLVMTATYLGTKGTRNQQQFLPNTYPVGFLNNPCPTCLPGYTYLTSNGNSERQAGTLQLRRRLHNGFTASLQYTFSKAIDDGALGGQTTGTAAGAAGARVSGSAVVAQDWLDLGTERALSNTDQRHVLNATLQYTSGMGVRGGSLLSGWRGVMLKHWTFLTNITAASGMPLTPIWGPYLVPNTGISSNVRPNYTGADLYAAPPGLFLNAAALGAPVYGQWGNAGRNSITGPAQFSLDASMQRSFNDGKFDFRLDATNALNHVVFTSWGVNATSPTFGLPTSVNGMRVVQVTIRWRFL